MGAADVGADVGSCVTFVGADVGVAVGTVGAADVGDGVGADVGNITTVNTVDCNT